jgi:tetratricopeptide (TPR) repeat protein
MSVRLRCAKCREEFDLPDVVFKEAANCPSCGSALWDVAAVRAYEAAAKQNPDDAETQCDLGLAYCRSGRLRRSVQTYETAICLKPDLVEAHCGLGLALSRTQRYKEAVVVYEAAIRLKPDCFRAYHNLALVYSSLGGRNDKAIEAAKAAITLDPNAAETYWFLGGFYLEMHFFPDAVECLTKAISLKSDLPDASELLNLACEGKTHYEELIETSKADILLEPEKAEGYLCLGLACVKLRRYMEAAEAFKMVTSLGSQYSEDDDDPDSDQPEMGLLQEAVQSLAMAIRLNPINAPAHLAMGIACFLMGQQREVLLIYETLRSLAPDMAKTLRSIPGNDYWQASLS